MTPPIPGVPNHRWGNLDREGAQPCTMCGLARKPNPKRRSRYLYRKAGEDTWRSHDVESDDGESVRSGYRPPPPCNIRS